MKLTTGLFITIFKYFILKHDRLLIASVKLCLDFLTFCRLRTNTRTPLHIYPSSFTCYISPIAYIFFKSKPPYRRTVEGDATNLSFNSKEAAGNPIFIDLTSHGCANDT